MPIGSFSYRQSIVFFSDFQASVVDSRLGQCSGVELGFEFLGFGWVMVGVVRRGIDSGWSLKSAFPVLVSRSGIMGLCTVASKGQRLFHRVDYD